jgi:hypothetical protein
VSAGIVHLIVNAAGDNLFTYDGGTKYGFRFDGHVVDFELSQRLNELARDGLLVVDRSDNGSFVTPTHAGWAAVV